MSKAIGVLLLVAVVGVAVYVGCGPRAGVAKDKVMDKIDSMLGKLDVEMKKVEMAYGELEKATAGLRDQRIEAQVRLESLTNKKKEMVSQKEKLVSDLGKLKTMLRDAEASGSIERNGKEIKVEQLKALADNTVNSLKSLKDKLAQNEVIASAWAKNLEMLKKNDDTSKTQLAKLENQLEQIRSKKSSLDAMKEAATIAGPGVSISDKFDELTKSVDELLINVDTEWKIEEAKLDERMAEVQQETMLSLEELLDDKTDVSGTMNEIDKLLESEEDSGSEDPTDDTAEGTEN